MWEEFTQSIHTFTEDKRKLAQHTLGKKKATLILIPSIRSSQFSAKGSKREVYLLLQPSLEDSEEADTAKGNLPRETSTLPELPGNGKDRTGHEESSSLYAELGLSGSDMESDKEMPSMGRSGNQDEGQAGLDHGTLDEVQAGPNPDDINIVESLPLPTLSVLAGPNLEHSDVEITHSHSQPLPEHMDEGFTATTYPDVQENLKLTVDE
ncbi:hypothetical protein Tco_0513579 [Tanacetum coccineum]